MTARLAQGNWREDPEEQAMRSLKTARVEILDDAGILRRRDLKPLQLPKKISPSCTQFLDV